VVPYHNHTELWNTNNVATAVGCRLPFPYAKVLPEDNGERFFSEYLSIVMPSLKGVRRGEFGECRCALCRRTSIKPILFTAITSPTKKPQDVEIEEITNDDKAPTPTPSPPTPTIINVNSNVARRNASQPQQTATQIAYGAPNSVSRTLFGAPFNHMTPINIAPLIPMQFQLPFYFNNFAAQVVPCCAKYAAWLTARKGRPPHHPLCPKRS